MPPSSSRLQMADKAPLLSLWGCLQRPPPPLPPRPRGIERPGRGYGQEPSESEAGPQAVQAAEQARQAFGRGRGGMDGRGIVSVESLMDEIIDRAYDEDDEMGVRLRAMQGSQIASNAVSVSPCLYQPTRRPCLVVLCV